MAQLYAGHQPPLHGHLHCLVPAVTVARILRHSLSVNLCLLPISLKRSWNLCVFLLPSYLLRRWKTSMGINEMEEWMKKHELWRVTQLYLQLLIIYSKPSARNPASCIMHSKKKKIQTKLQMGTKKHWLHCMLTALSGANTIWIIPLLLSAEHSFLTMCSQRSFPVVPQIWAPLGTCLLQLMKISLID